MSGSMLYHLWGKIGGDCSVADRTQRAERVIWLDFRSHSFTARV